MQLAASLYQPSRVAAILLFICTMVLSIVLNTAWFCILPFAYILVPPLLLQIATRPTTIFWILLVSIPFSTEINITPSLGIDFPDEGLLMILTFLIVLKWVYNPVLFKAFPFKHTLVLLITLHLIWIFITIFFSTNPLLSLKYFIAKIWFILPFVLLPSLFFTQADFKRTGIAWLVPTCVLAVQVIIRHAAEGFSFEGIKETLSPFFRNHVAYAAWIIYTLPLAICMYWLTKNSLHRKLLKIAMLLLVVAIILSFSRGAWLAVLLAGAGAYAIHKKLLKQFLWIAGIMVITVTGWLINQNRYTRFRPQFEQTIYHDEFGKHMEATVTLKDVSNAERFHRWVAGVKMVKEKPFIGFGPNNFYANYKPYTDVHFRTWVSDNEDHSTVHNYYLLLAIEQGLPGMLIFIVLIVAGLIKAQQLYHETLNEAHRMMSITIGTILIMVAAINSINDMIETDKTGAVFWFCMGLLIVLDAKMNKERA